MEFKPCTEWLEGAEGEYVVRGHPLGYTSAAASAVNQPRVNKRSFPFNGILRVVRTYVCDVVLGTVRR